MSKTQICENKNNSFIYTTKKNMSINRILTINEILKDFLPTDYLINEVLKYDTHTKLMEEVKKGKELKFNALLYMFYTGNPYWVYSKEAVWDRIDIQNNICRLDEINNYDYIDRDKAIKSDLKRNSDLKRLKSQRIILDVPKFKFNI